ncbi:MAG TPA: bifunctional pyr operon transcriptional regulator/uracil phosphoribosyltransferase PyrR [Chthoniobacterales bacterium]
MTQIPEKPATVVVMDADAIRKAIRRIAHEIIEQNSDVSRLVLAGIPTRGVEVARRLVDHIASVEGVRPEMGVVDVSMHRDDLATRKRFTALEETQLPFDLEGRTLVLVDDVLYTGRSCRAAMDAVASFGRPDRIQLAVLVDRGHRELPIRPDYVGRNVPTERTEKIRVRFENSDNVPDSVQVVKP